MQLRACSSIPVSRGITTQGPPKHRVSVPCPPQLSLKKFFWAKFTNCLELISTSCNRDFYEMVKALSRRRNYVLFFCKERRGLQPRHQIYSSKSSKKLTKHLLNYTKLYAKNPRSFKKTVILFLATPLPPPIVNIRMSKTYSCLCYFDEFLPYNCFDF